MLSPTLKVKDKHCVYLIKDDQKILEEQNSFELIKRKLNIELDDQIIHRCYGSLQQCTNNSK